MKKLYCVFISGKVMYLGKFDTKEECEEYAEQYEKNLGFTDKVLYFKIE